MPRLLPACPGALLLTLLGACSGGGEAPSSAPAAATSAAPSPTPAPSVPPERILSEAEYALLKDNLADMRAGVRGFSDNSVGVCTRKGKTCGEPLGTSPDALPNGDYLLWAELRAPQLGPDDGWPVTLSTRCEIETQGGSRTSDDSRTYTVRYAGEERGYRLRLREFSSPAKGGPTACTWALRSDAEGGRVIAEGRWSLPSEGA